MVSDELLVKYGFLKKKGEEIDHKGQDWEEHSWNAFKWVGFPKPLTKFKLSWERYDMSMEEPYFWAYRFLKEDLGMPFFDKTEDVFSAAENSAFFGSSQQRLGIQQDRISSFLISIAKLIRELFQIVRELRIIDERLGYYRAVDDEVKKPFDQRQSKDDITLKGIFIDLVQGGAKSPASVFGMASQLEFTTLPDLFFQTKPLQINEIEAEVDRLDFNLNVKRVLKRHLNQYTRWREATFKEVTGRRSFMLNFLKQHHDVIRMYIAWIKPYLKHVKRLSIKSEHMQQPDIISAIETSMLDVEFIARQKHDDYWAIVLCTFNYRTRPDMKFVQEGYQRGPIHVGKLVINFRSYVWTQKELDNYVKMKEDEEFELISDVSESVKEAMDALGDDLKRYVDEARGLSEVKEEEGKFKPSLFRRMFKDFLPEKLKDKRIKKPKKPTKKKGKGAAEGNAKLKTWLVYSIFKKAHGMFEP